MYWYFKYPLIVILVLIVAGIGQLVWRSVRNDEGASPQEIVMPVDKDPEASQNGPDEAASDPASAAEEAAAAKSSAAELSAELYAAIEKQLDNAELQLSKGSLEAARRLATIAMSMEGCAEFDKYWYRAFDVINEVNRRFMNSTAPSSEKKRYNVMPGDNLTRIANKLYTCPSALSRINGLDKDNPVIHPHQVLGYLPGAWRIRVSKQHFTLILYLDNRPYRYYRVGIGREDRTPVGTFLINSRIYHPAWTPPGKHIPYGEKGNVLGTHWMGLLPTDGTDATLSGYGIHGTEEPDSIGTAASSGCIRMRNEEVGELFDFIPEPGGHCPPVKVTIEE